MSNNSNTHHSGAHIDFLVYTRAPSLPANACLGLARALAGARPLELTAREQSALDEVLRAAECVHAVLEERSKLRACRVRPRLDAFISAWTCGCELLDAYARLGSPFGARAAALRRVLFTQRLTFLSGDARAVWSEGERRYRRLLSESSREELAAVVGGEVALWMESTTRELGDHLGCGHVPVRRQAAGALTDAIRAVQSSIVHYARVLAASASPDEPDRAERFRRAMGPLDDYRAGRAGRGARRASRRATDGSS